MRPILPKLRSQLDALPRMHKCELAPMQRLYGRCSGRIQWHHVWIYAGRQINELWAIVGACEGHHEEVKKDAAIRQYFESASLSYATDADLAEYPKKDWLGIKRMLGLIRKKHGTQGT